MWIKNTPLMHIKESYVIRTVHLKLKGHLKHDMDALSLCDV